MIFHCVDIMRCCKRKSDLQLWETTSSIEVCIQTGVIIFTNIIYVDDIKPVTVDENRGKTPRKLPNW